jgi:hypothetical protein
MLKRLFLFHRVNQFSFERGQGRIETRRRHTLDNLSGLPPAAQRSARREGMDMTEWLGDTLRRGSPAWCARPCRFAKTGRHIDAIRLFVHTARLPWLRRVIS